MFKSNIQNYIIEATQFPSTINVNMPPTVDTVRLMTEMQQAATKSVTDSIRLENCILDVVVHRMHEYISCKIKFAIHFKINGTKFETEYAANNWDTEESIQLGIRDTIAERIANAIVSSIVNKIRK